METAKSCRHCICFIPGTCQVNSQYKVMRILKIILALLLGAVYIFSAYSKLFPIEPFEYTFVDVGISSWKLSPFMARTVIGLEFFIGLLFIFQIGTRSF